MVFLSKIIYFPSFPPPSRAPFIPPNSSTSPSPGPCSRSQRRRHRRHSLLGKEIGGMLSILIALVSAAFSFCHQRRRGRRRIFDLLFFLWRRHRTKEHEPPRFSALPAPFLHSAGDVPRRVSPGQARKDASGEVLSGWRQGSARKVPRRERVVR